MLRPTILFIITFLILFTLPATGQQDDTLPMDSNSPAGTLILNEISPWPSDDTVWVEFINPTDEPVTLDGWNVEFNSGFSYTFPENAGEISGGGLHLLNISGGNPLNPNGDGCTLSDSNGPVDAIMWGVVYDSSTGNLTSGPPLQPGYESMSDSQNLYQPGDVILRIPGTNGSGIENWAWRHENHATRGSTNPYPGPWLMMPYDGARLASTFSLGVSGLDWSGGVTFQVATDEAFSDIVIEETVDGNSLPIESIPAGKYFWRVSVLDANGNPTGSWSMHQSFTREDFDIDELIETTDPISSLDGVNEIPRLAMHKGGGWIPPTWHNLGMAPVNHTAQQKDTRMVCHDGCRKDGNFAWDVAHPYGVMSGRHSDHYCARACIAMIARQYGFTMSQDRITYYIFEELGTASQDAVETGHIGDPRGDLGPGTGAYHASMARALDWVYNLPTGSAFVQVFNNLSYDNPTAAKDSITEYIADDRPVIMSQTGHARLIDGHVTIYREGIGFDYVHIQDPWYTGASARTWELYEPKSDCEFIYPPSTGIPSRNEEAGVTTDSDGDGLVDFDETERFFTDPNDPDTDGDGLDDKIDMLGYIFLPNGNYRWMERDLDGDGLAKELDPDNDDSNDMSSPDGCEDANKDGFFDPLAWETDNFEPGDDYDFINPECLKGWIRAEWIFNIHQEGMNHDQHWLEQVTIENSNLDGAAFEHEHKWERWIVGSAPEFGWTWDASDNDSGLASVKLEHDPATDEYFLITETQLEWRNFELMHEVHPLALAWIAAGPTYFYFAGGARHPLGTPREVNGGLLLEDVWYPDEQASAPQFIYRISWQIWVTPPTR